MIRVDTIHGPFLRSKLYMPQTAAFGCPHVSASIYLALLICIASIYGIQIHVKYIFKIFSM